MQAKLSMAQALIEEEARKTSDAEGTVHDYRRRLDSLLQAGAAALSQPVDLSATAAAAAVAANDGTNSSATVSTPPRGARMSGPAIPTVDSLTPKSSEKGKGRASPSRLKVTQSPLGHVFTAPATPGGGKGSGNNITLSVNTKVVAAAAALLGVALAAGIANFQSTSAQPLPTAFIFCVTTPVCLVFLVLAALLYSK